MNLYWVTTEDHHEDWFVLASSSGEACRFHETNEGYDSGEAVAELVLAIPKDISTETGWPSEEILETLGATFLQKGSSRVVEVEGRKFAEGMLESLIREIGGDVSESDGDDRFDGTRRSTAH
jgi:hypothetical protein